MEGIGFDYVHAAETFELVDGLVEIGAVAGKGKVLVRHSDVTDKALYPVPDGRVDGDHIGSEINDSGFLAPERQEG
jgi:hypothetical protein